jgi:hypothetical protein
MDLVMHHRFVAGVRADYIWWCDFGKCTDFHSAVLCARACEEKFKTVSFAKAREAVNAQASASKPSDTFSRCAVDESCRFASEDRSRMPVKPQVPYQVAEPVSPSCFEQAGKAITEVKQESVSPQRTATATVSTVENPSFSKERVNSNHITFSGLRSRDCLSSHQTQSSRVRCESASSPNALFTEYSQPICFFCKIAGHKKRNCRKRRQFLNSRWSCSGDPWKPGWIPGNAMRSFA